MNAGDRFDPVDVTRRLKLYPVQVVDARRDLSDGPKRLYALLFRIALLADRRKYPWLGYVYTSESFLAQCLGKSESGVRRDAASLREAGLIQVERPNRQQNNQYSFLWKSDFHHLDSSCGDCSDRANVGGQELQGGPSDRADVSAQENPDRADVSAQNGSDRANVGGPDRANVRGAYKEITKSVKNTEGSARGVRDGFLKFQAEYPEAKNKIRVDSACRAYLSVIDGRPGEHDLLMAGLKRYKASADWQRSLSEDDGRYIPAMVTFISERRYMDSPPAADEAPEVLEVSRRAPSLASGLHWDPVSEDFVPAEGVR